MIRAQTDFRERVAEIEAYLAFVQKIEAGDTLLIQRDSQMPAYASTDQKNLIRTFQASAFLLLYNLMESTVSNAIEAIFDEFSNRGTSFDSCRPTIRRVVLGNLKQHNLDDILPDLNSLSIDIVTKTFQKNKIVSGNVDAKKIRDVADEYGFARPSADGNPLLTVKTSRNDLAHGSKSFAEVGRDYTIAQIISIKEKVVAYLDAMLINVTTYINQQHYLAAPDRP